MNRTLVLLAAAGVALAGCHKAAPADNADAATAGNDTVFAANEADPTSVATDNAALAADNGAIDASNSALEVSPVDNAAEAAPAKP